MANVDHYALVVALSHYPNLVNGGLRGPQNDAAAFVDWLKSPSGGNIPPANIKCVTSADFVNKEPGDDIPWPEHLNKAAFKWIYDMACASRNAGRGFRVGKRIYFYLSGHGFASADRNGCLLTANTSEGRADTNIGISNWLNWWRNAACFDEYVLLLDACMNRLVTAVPRPAPYKLINSYETPGECFLAYAAKAPKKTVERSLPTENGKFHGVFTWCLLEGLTGAAANSSNLVTGKTLQNWLVNSMYHWFTDSDRDDIDVSLEPDILTADQTLVLATNVKPKTYSVELIFPDEVVGRTLRVWSGPGPQFVSETAEKTTRLDLHVGLHVVDCGDLRQGFEVVGPQRVNVSQRGSPVLVPSGRPLFHVTLSAGDTANQIILQDANFDPVVAPGGHVEVDLPFGLYRSRFRVGRRFVDDVFLLDGDYAPGASVTARDLPGIASAVPFNGAPRSHERQSVLVGEVQNNAVPADGSQIAVVARGWTPKDTGYSIANPWKGIRVLGANGKVVGDIGRSGVKTLGEGDFDGSAHLTANVAPGAYFLRYPYPQIGIVEVSLVTARGWRTEVYLLRSRTSSEGPETLPRRTIIMRRQNQPWRHEQNDRLEKALFALAYGRAILNRELSDLLLHKFDSPIEGIVGAHLLLIEHARRADVDLSQLDPVVINLRSLLGGDHPDVEALSLMCANEDLRRRRPFDTPPMFERSWRLMVEASRKDPKMVSLRLWKRVAAQVVMPPYFGWSTAETRAHYRDALIEAATDAHTSPDRSVGGPSLGLKDIGDRETLASNVPLDGELDAPAAHPMRGPDRGGSERDSANLERLSGIIRPPGSQTQPPPDPEVMHSFAEAYRLPPAAVRSISRSMSQSMRPAIKYNEGSANPKVAVDKIDQEYPGETHAQDELAVNSDFDEH
ncbi:MULTISPECIES: hypothetical protein [Sinorhizobium]|uniref:hypothetical protein n=1 Tax=Sinorhizobium TaxID=28105 RepID=UPI0024B0AA95|nr:hypothetical protein [Sinorhizobium terangae]WFU51883.1 hypothetical protein QA637_28625 [Sinorhizobium terangae]